MISVKHIKKDKNMTKILPQVQQPIFDKIVKIISEKFQLKPEEVSLDLYFGAGRGQDNKGLGADSLDMMELFMDFEKAFGINVADENLEKVRNVGDAVKLVEELMSKTQPRNKNLQSAKTKGDNNLPNPTLTQLLAMPFGDVLALLKQHVR